MGGPGVWTIIAEDWRHSVWAAGECTDKDEGRRTKDEGRRRRNPLSLVPCPLFPCPLCLAFGLLRSVGAALRLRLRSSRPPDRATPPAERGASRLLVVDRTGGTWTDRHRPICPRCSRLVICSSSTTPVSCRTSARSPRSQRRACRVPAASSDRLRALGRADAPWPEDEAGYARALRRAARPARRRGPRPAHVRPPDDPSVVVEGAGRSPRSSTPSATSRCRHTSSATTRRRDRERYQTIYAAASRIRGRAHGGAAFHTAASRGSRAAVSSRTT